MFDSNQKFRWEYEQEAFVYTTSIPANIVWLSQRYFRAYVTPYLSVDFWRHVYPKTDFFVMTI